jgi:signal transduction histidine kinase
MIYEIRFDANFKEEKDRSKVNRNEEAVPLLNIPYFLKEEEFDP